MSIAGILSSILFQPNNLQGQQNQFQKIQQEFQQLGQDLQAGNLSQAQQDFATFAQSAPNGSQNTSPIAQDFSALAQALQSGNMANAQQAFTTLQQDLQQGSGLVGHHRHHHHHGESGFQGSNSTSGTAYPFAQDFSALGKALQSGNLAAAQQAYSTIQQDFQQFGAAGSNSNASFSNQTTTNPLAVTA